jgi:PAS domain S-box-containing protein
MPILLVLDIVGLTFCFVLSAALALLVGAADFRRAVNRVFVSFALMECGWAATSLLLRLALWFRTGSPQTLLGLATIFFAAMSPSLLVFCALYVRAKLRWLVVGTVVLVLVLLSAVPWLLNGTLLGGAELRANGTVLYHMSPLGEAGSFLPVACLAASLVLIGTARRRRTDRFIAISIAFLLAGYVLGGILQVSAPVMSLALTAGVALLGWGIVRRQLLNPLRDLTLDLRERAHRQDLIAQVSRRTTMLLDLDELLPEAVRLIRDSFDYFTVSLFLVQGTELVLSASTLPELQADPRRIRLRIGEEGICGAAAAAGAPILVGDVSKDTRYVVMAKDVQTRSELAVPIQRSGRVIGVLDVQSARLEGFTQADVLTQQTIADQLSIAIENARLYEETRRRAERLALVNRTSSAAGAVLDLDELLATIYREVTPIFEADAFFIALYDPEAGGLEFRILVDEGMREPPLREPLGTGLTARVITQRRPLLVNGMVRDAANGLPPETWGTGKIPTSWIGVPMLVGERIIGVMSVQTYRDRLYEEDDLLLAATIGDQVAVAVENARLYETVRLELDVRQRTEEGLRESEEKFRNLAEESPNMIFINRGGRVVYANRQCEVTMGYTREELYSPDFSFQRMTAPGYEPLLERNFRRHMRAEEVLPYEYTMLTRTGRRIDAILTTKLIRYGEQPAILGIITDITTRARTGRLVQSLNTAALAMEQALTPAEIFPAASRVLSALGHDTAIFLAEPGRTLRVHSWTVAVASGTHVVSTDTGSPVSFDASRLVAQALDSRATLFATPEEGGLERLYADAGIPGGTGSRSAGVIIAPLVVGEELIGVLVLSGSDVSRDDVPIYAVFAHQAAAAWRKTRLMRDLQASLQQLRQTQEQLLSAQKMEAVGRLAGGIAHDFNNLLTVISGYTSLLAETVPADSPSQGDLGQIRNTIKRASALTSRLLAFSRKQILQPTVMDMNRVVSASLSLLRPLIGEDIELAVHLAPQPVSVRADHSQMEQVLMNLAVNARDAMPGGGRLLVQTGVVDFGQGGPPVFSAPGKDSLARLPADLSPGSWVVLRVQDNGVGMSEETREHIFEPFFTTKEEGKGSGLGLSTVYGIVTQSGGKVRVDSVLGRGSAFTVCLPRVGESADSEAEAEPPNAGPPGAGTILLVEDEVGVRELARRVLERAGYRVITAASAREALLIAEGSTVLECVVTDVVMPGGMSGVEMGERLSRSRPSLPVLYMSGYTDDARFHANGETRLPFLGKPFLASELLQKLHELLKKKQP